MALLSTILFWVSTKMRAFWWLLPKCYVAELAVLCLVCIVCYMSKLTHVTWTPVFYVTRIFLDELLMRAMDCFSEASVSEGLHRWLVMGKQHCINSLNLLSWSIFDICKIESIFQRRQPIACSIWLRHNLTMTEAVGESCFWWLASRQYVGWCSFVSFFLWNYDHLWQD